MAKDLAQPDDPESVYDRFYYSYYCSGDTRIRYERNPHWLGFFGYIADRIVSDLDPKTVLDAGCAMGFLVEALRDRGVDADGVDISEFALSQVRDDVRGHCWQASVTDPLSHRYDLIVCIETLEHLNAIDAERAVDNLCSFTDDVIFTSTPDNYREVSHLNVRPPEYWAELFARRGLYRDVDYDPSSYIAPWAVRFRRLPDPAPRAVANYERLLWRVRQENRDLRAVNRDYQQEIASGIDRLEAGQAELERREVGLAALTAELEAARSLLDARREGRVWRFLDWALPLGSRRRELVKALNEPRPRGRRRATSTRGSEGGSDR